MDSVGQGLVLVLLVTVALLLDGVELELIIVRDQIASLRMALDVMATKLHPAHPLLVSRDLYWAPSHTVEPEYMTVLLQEILHLPSTMVHTTTPPIS